MFETPNIEIRVTKKEKTLIELLRGIPYGQVTIYLENGQPIRVVKVERSIKL